ncbi:hypothetical protein PP740_gp043 [Stenotrophomonas phage Philippe]|uniref:Uncharacterized protein n=1 Tax=Stenotrophomonas phage Philippe TaxID=2859655 RepID=A0AAE7WMK6_9CAUD|nr:hypothetical protein PP740_gp043 [Stenotrophomonas phage Philippe]QYW02242.1 hypothetical protein CPT_Philippe_043 [Stenotrophomonas phage Philippe]
MIDYKKRAIKERRRKGKARYAAYISGLRNYAPMQGSLRAKRSHASGNDVAAGWDV